MKNALKNQSLNGAVCKTIRALRRENRRSQKDIADFMGISIPAFSKIESGFTDINLSRLEQIADAFGISLVQLLSPGQEITIPAATTPQVGSIQRKIENCEREIAHLQRKVIELYEELYCKVPVAI